MPRAGLKIHLDEYNEMVEQCGRARKRKDYQTSTPSRSFLLLQDGKTFEETAQILEVVRSTVQYWVDKHRRVPAESEA